MKGAKIFLVLTFLSAGCGSNYYLRRAKINTFKAIAHGAKIDSLVVVKRDTIKVDGVVDVRTIKEVRVDTTWLHTICPEVTTPTKIKQLQKAVCPDVGIDTTYRLSVIVDGRKYPVLIRVQAYSRAGKTFYSLTSKAVKVPYKRAVYSTNVSPGNGGVKWWHLVLVGLGCLIAGFVVGKVFSIGLKL